MKEFECSACHDINRFRWNMKQASNVLQKFNHTKVNDVTRDKKVRY